MSIRGAVEWMKAVVGRSGKSGLAGDADRRLRGVPSTVFAGWESPADWHVVAPAVPSTVLPAAFVDAPLTPAFVSCEGFGPTMQAGETWVRFSGSEWTLAASSGGYVVDPAFVPAPPAFRGTTVVPFTVKLVDPPVDPAPLGVRMMTLEDGRHGDQESQRAAATGPSDDVSRQGAAGAGIVHGAAPIVGQAGAAGASQAVDPLGRDVSAPGRIPGT